MKTNVITFIAEHLCCDRGGVLHIRGVPIKPMGEHFPNFCSLFFSRRDSRYEVSPPPERGGTAFQLLNVKRAGESGRGARCVENAREKRDQCPAARSFFIPPRRDNGYYFQFLKIQATRARGCFGPPAVLLCTTHPSTDNKALFTGLCITLK